MRILITIPTWNEATIIAKTLETVLDFVKKDLSEHEVMIEVADNGSTDGTREIVNSFVIPAEAGIQVKVFLLEISEKGKGLAIRRSWEKHLDDADVLLFTDADLAADLSAIPKMITLILSGEADLVCASRFLGGSRVERRLHREIASRLFRFLQHQLLGLPVEDAQCGLKAISARKAAELLPLCQETGWLFDTELLALSTAKKAKISEISVSWVEHRDPARRSALRLFRDGWGFLLGLARIRRRLL